MNNRVGRDSPALSDELTHHTVGEVCKESKGRTMRLHSIRAHRSIRHGFLAFLVGFAILLNSEIGSVRLAQAAPTPAVGIARTSDNGGYWIATRDGAVYSYGNARYHGGANGIPHAPIVGIAATSTGSGYWLVASDGAIYSFGDAQYKGGANGIPHAPIVDMADRSDNGGYWELADDGAIYAYGTASYYGGANGGTPTRVQLAQTILNSSNRITLATVHPGGTDAASTAGQNIRDTASGGQAATSPWSDVGVTRVWVSMPMLDGMSKLANIKGFSYSMSEVAGGDHSSGSRHYTGRAADFNVINGVSVLTRGRDTTVQNFMNACRAYGATQVLGPGDDAAHANHVHCGW